MTREAASPWDVPGLADRLTALVKDGDSASGIAATLNEEYHGELAALGLGGLSRNAVLGRVHRAAKAGGPGLQRKPRLPGVPRRPRPMPTRPPIPRKEPAPRAARVALPGRPREGLVEPPALLSGSAAEVIAQLTDGVCKWPEGDPGSGHMTMCGHARWPGSSMPYCEHHTRRAIDPNGRGRPQRPFGDGPATVLASEFDAGARLPKSADGEG